jgi:hypothetical protein
MTGLLADGWFYISSAGLLVSGILFFFLLGQYRAASEAADQPEAETAVEPSVPAVRPVWSPESSAPLTKVASFSPVKTEEKTPVMTAGAAPPKAAEPKPESAPSAADKRRDAGLGGVSPAVVYLQNIKTQLDELHGETRSLAKRVEAISGRDEALIERLTELTQAVAELKARPSAAAPAPASVEVPKRVKKVEAPAAAPAPTPVVSIPATLSIERTTVAGVPETIAEPKREAKPEPTPEPKLEAKLEPKAEPKIDLPKPEPKPERKTEPLPEPVVVSKPEPKKVLSADETVRFELDAVIESQLSKVTGRKPAPDSPAPAAEPEPDEKPRRGPVWPV